MTKLRGDLRRDDGMGLVLVMGVITIVLSLTALTITIAMNSLSSSRRHVTFGQSLDASEAGIDFALARLQGAWDTYGADYPIPSPVTSVETTPACTAPTISTPYPGGTFPSATVERTWARTQLLALAAAQPSCVRNGGSGQYIVLKPTDKQIVYSLGWSPSMSAANPDIRLVKSEYIFSPYRPEDAVLVGGSLNLGSSVSVSSVTGAAATTASVHANGQITVSTGNPTVTGPVTSTGTSAAQSNNFTSNPGGTVYSTDASSVPYISAQSFYFQNVAKYTATQWYDLCPDGTIRAGSTGGPCTSSTIWATSAVTGVGGWRGWTFATVSGAPTWAATKNLQSYSGVYYANHANVITNSPNGNVTVPSLTVIASSLNPDDCTTKQYGNISWDGIDISSAYVQGLFMLADQDLTTSANITVGSPPPSLSSGMFYAGDQVSFQTSANSVVGGVVAGDQCAISGSPVATSELKNATIVFDPNAFSPVTSIINTTLWLEYVG